MKINKYKYITILGLLAVLVLQTLWIRNSYNLTAGDLKKKCDETLKSAMFLETYQRSDLLPPNTPLEIPFNSNATPKLDYFEDKLYEKLKIDASLPKMDLSQRNY